MFDERGSGRNRSETANLRARLDALDERLTSTLHNIPTASDANALRLHAEAVFFLAESYAWAIVNYGRAVLFDERLDLPRTDAEVFSCLSRAGRLDLVQARKLKQFCELRLLSTRDYEKTDVSEVYETLRARGEIHAMLVLFPKATT